MEDVKNSINLIYYVKDAEGKEAQKSFDVPFRVASMAVRDKFLKIREEWMEEMYGIEKKYPKLEELRKEGKDIPSNDSPLLIENTKYNGEITKVSYKHTIKLFKEMLDQRQLIAEHKTLIALAPDKDFWMEQNIILIEEAVKSFRESNSV